MKPQMLIKGVEWEGQIKDILIEGQYIKQIADSISVTAGIEIDGQGKALIPGLINAHTHAAMTLFRGIGDDMLLMPWLKEKIWPNEALLTHEDVYWGAKLACLEMIKSGTTAFLDMYYKLPATAEAVQEMGIRGVLSCACFDHFNPEQAGKSKQEIQSLFAGSDAYGPRIKFALGPHAIYTVSGALLQWIDTFSEEHNLLIQMHVAETEEEVSHSVKQFAYTPVRYLNKLGVLSPRLSIAHGLYVDEEEIRILADKGVKVVHNPASNMKLASGTTFKFTEMRKAGITVGIGTDGCSSSNNLDMTEAMKLASLLGKAWRKNPEALTADEMLYAATGQGADILELKTGRIAEGYLADLCLIDLNLPAFTPNHHFTSNLVYAANGSCIDTVICDGKLLMQNKKVPGEEEILKRVTELAKKFR
ncbi:MAG: amidohydrolase [Tannerellaceae bacterium]|jgi:5-methylthioadenosine/S-adenosylhomocysteine deaminase|nr:amidohydrolase [Tannerellaceae bacterium]